MTANKYKDVHSMDLVGMTADNLGLKEITLFSYKTNKVSGASHLNPDADIEKQFELSKDDRTWSQIINECIDENKDELDKKGLAMGLCNIVLDHQDMVKFWLFFDMTGRYYGLEQLKDSFHHLYSNLTGLGFAILESGNSCHIYTKELLDEESWRNYLIEASMYEIGCGFHVDERWALRSMYQGQATLRLTKTKEKRKVPKCIFSSSDFSDAAPWMPGGSTFEPDNDLPF